MRLAFTVTQKQRLVELDAEESITGFVFESEEERDRSFKIIDRELVLKNKKRLELLRLERIWPEPVRILTASS